MKTFAERLKAAIQEAEISQTILAQRTGLSRAAISQYLHGKIVPTPKNLQALASATGVTPEHLLGIEEDNPKEKKCTVPPDMKPITLRQAAACLHMADQNVRTAIENGTLPIGRVVRVRGGRPKVLITPEKLCEEVGEARFNKFFGITN